VLPDDADGLCNAVYVDDVVDALLLAAGAEAAVGQRILVSAERPVTWHEYFRAYERALGTDSIVLMPTRDLQRATAWGRPQRLALALRREPVRTAALLAAKVALRPLRSSIREPLSRRVRKHAAPWKIWVPDGQQLALYRTQATVSIERARRVLGFEPRFDFERGMALTRDWIRWAGL